MSHKKIYLLASLFLILSLACSFSGNSGNTGNTGNAGAAGSEGSAATPTEEEIEGDACLIGTWQQDAAEMSSNLSQILAGSGMEVVSMEGVAVLEIDESQMKLTPEGYVAEIRDSDGKVITGTFSGYNIAAYTVVGEGLIVSTNVENTLVLTMSVGGVGIDFPVEGGFGYSGEGGVAFPYTCTDTTLTAQTPPDVPFDSSTFTRVSSPPED